MAAIANVQIRVQQVRAYKSIDFILPGQLGFSLLAGSVFGTAFVFFNLRQTLVLKRFFATPVRKEIIVIFSYEKTSNNIVRISQDTR